MAEFIEERLPINISYSSSFGESYNVEVSETAGGNEYRRLNHASPRLNCDVSYSLRSQLDLLNGVVDLYHRCYGRFAGFRVRNLAYYSTNAHTGTPTAFDQDLALVSAGVYQLVMRYGDVAKPAATIGRPVRNLYKPVAGTTKVGIGALEQATPAMWSVSTITGRVTFAANKTRSVTAITLAASAVVTVGAHTFAVGESVHFTGVVGMTQINGLRGAITAIAATTITVAINSATGFSMYSSAGTVNTNPQTGEVVKGGCEYDIPCRWDSDLSQITYENFESLGIGNMQIKEILNP